MTTCRAAAIAALFLLLSAMGAAAQDVTLASRDGEIAISGSMLGFDGRFYRVDTDYGELTVDGAGVDCAGPGCPDTANYVPELRFSGAAGIGDVLLPALIEAFALRGGMGFRAVPVSDGRTSFELDSAKDGRTIARFHVRASNTDEGFADLLAQEADIVMALREIRADEAVLARDAGMGDLIGPYRSRVLALDALVPVTAPGHPVTAISLSDLAKVFGGRIDTWQALGGPDRPVVPWLHDPRTGHGQAVQDRLLAPAGLHLAQSARHAAAGTDLTAAVLADPGALGLVAFSEIGDGQAMALTGTCGFVLHATRRSVKTEDYPLTAPMFLYLPMRRLPRLALDFLAFTRSPAAQIVIRRAGFVDQTPEEIGLDAQGRRFANAISAAGPETGLAELQRLVGLLGPLTRLSTSFRFEAGSTRLDAQSRSNVQQLAHALRIGVYDGRQIVFAGFSDGDGPAEANREIAARRAEAVRTAVARAAGAAATARIPLSVEAFGEALPMACDDTEWGRQVNRRVEVWLR